MTAISSNTAQRAAERLEAVLTAAGEKFDVFVSYQMRRDGGRGRTRPHHAAGRRTRKHRHAVSPA